MMQIVHCDESFSGQILAILNHAILTSTALYDYRPRTQESMKTWFAAKRTGNYPVVGAVNDAGELLGFASYGVFRAWPAYKYSVEHSVYVSAQHRGQGIGRFLLQSIVQEAANQGFHALVGGIDSENQVSMRLHESLGFQRIGMLRQVGFKFNRWLDLVLFQLLLSTPANPVDG